MSSRLRRAAAWLAGAWAGLVAGVGFVAAPVLFATLPRGDAGRAAARLFEVDATVGVCAGALLLLLALQIARADAEQRGGSRFSAEMLLVLAALACIVAGHYAIQPMIDAARRGEGGASFALLHGIASLFFAAKFVAVAVLAWRLTRAPREIAGKAAAGGAAREAAAKAAAPTS